MGGYPDLYNHLFGHTSRLWRFQSQTKRHSQRFSNSQTRFTTVLTLASPTRFTSWTDWRRHIPTWILIGPRCVGVLRSIVLLRGRPRKFRLGAVCEITLTRSRALLRSPDTLMWPKSGRGGGYPPPLPHHLASGSALGDSG